MNRDEVPHGPERCRICEVRDRDKVCPTCPHNPLRDLWEDLRRSGGGR
jgi:RNA polymerase subunit RPABC4/transcription elongation factor Spt4